VIPASAPNIVTADEVARKDISAVTDWVILKVVPIACVTRGSTTANVTAKTSMAAVADNSDFTTFSLMIR
jgi:hypothetical protein